MGREKRTPGNERWGGQKRSQNTLCLYLNYKQWVGLQQVGNMAPISLWQDGLERIREIGAYQSPEELGSGWDGIWHR